MADPTPNPEYPTILGPDASFKGELTFEKGLRLQGKFDGQINTQGRLLVAKEARMHANVEAGAIIIEGEVKGNLVATDKIELKNSGPLRGRPLREQVSGRRGRKPERPRHRRPRRRQGQPHDAVARRHEPSDAAGESEPGQQPTAEIRSATFRTRPQILRITRVAVTGALAR